MGIERGINAIVKIMVNPFEIDKEGLSKINIDSNVKYDSSGNSNM